MSFLLKILVPLLGLLYIISPYDIIPDFIPFLGRGDDLFVLGALLYYVWRGKIPWLKLGQAKRPDNERDDHHGADRTETTGTPSDPYEILGIKTGAPPHEIREAYRKISHKYHPDKVSHLGSEFQELAQRKFIQINKAYQWIREKEGW